MPINTYRGSITLPNEVSNMIIQSTQEASAVMALANKINLPGPGITIPMITADPEADWVAETAAKPVSNPSLSTKVMTPYKLAVIVPFSDEFARDYDALYDALVARIPGALAKKFDATVFHGSAPGSGFNVLAGCTAQTISGSGNSFYGALVNADVAIAAQGGDVNGYAFSPQARGEMLSALDTTERPIFVNNVTEGAIPRLLGHPVHYSKGAYKAGTSGSGATPDVIGFAGDWTKAWYGTVEGVKIDISNQATLTISGTAVNLWEHNMFAVKAEIEVSFIADTNVFNRITRTRA